MATNAHIGYIENNKITYTYLHYDGYPSHVGRVLYEEYNDINTIKELIKLGYLESIDSDEVIAFHRDKGHNFDNVKPERVNDLNEFTTCEFNYLFDVASKRWTFFTNLGEFDLEREYNNNFIPDSIPE